MYCCTLYFTFCTENVGTKSDYFMCITKLIQSTHLHLVLFHLLFNYNFFNEFSVNYKITFLIYKLYNYAAKVTTISYIILYTLTLLRVMLTCFNIGHYLLFISFTLDNKNISELSREYQAAITQLCIYNSRAFIYFTNIIHHKFLYYIFT